MAEFSHNRPLKSGSSVEDFVGVVTRRDPDGYGLVEISSPGKLDHKFGVFTREVFQDPLVSRQCKVGKPVKGRVHVDGAGLRIIRLEPS